MKKIHPLLTKVSKSTTDPSNNFTCLEGNTLIMDDEGKLYSLEDLAGEYQSELIVACVDEHGRLTTSTAHSFRIGQWTDQLYTTTFANGHKIRSTNNHPFLGASGDWVLAEELSFGTVLRSAIYDPANRNPSLALNEVIHTHIETLDEKIPMYDFTVEKHGNLFIAQEIEDTISLIIAHNSSL